MNEERGEESRHEPNRVPLIVLLVLISLSVLGAIHLIALEFKLYFYFPWLDIPVHALGGATIALALFATHTSIEAVPTRYLEFIPTILIVLMVGLMWEVFEIWAGIPLLETDFEEDIVYDLIMDMVGGGIGWFVGTRLKSL